MRRERHHCEGCGEVAQFAEDLRRLLIRGAREHIALCQGCWADVIACRYWDMSVQAILEGLWDHRYRAPQRHAPCGDTARARDACR